MSLQHQYPDLYFWVTTHSRDETDRLAAFLIKRSRWFECDPWPEDEWHFQLKRDGGANIALVSEFLGRPV